jgi:hypothetical protein
MRLTNSTNVWSRKAVGTALAVRLPGVDDHLGVAGGAEAMAGGAQRVAQRGEVAVVPERVGVAMAERAHDSLQHAILRPLPGRREEAGDPAHRRQPSGAAVAAAGVSPR